MPYVAVMPDTRFCNPTSGKGFTELERRASFLIRVRLIALMAQVGFTRASESLLRGGRVRRRLASADGAASALSSEIMGVLGEFPGITHHFKRPWPVAGDPEEAKAFLLGDGCGLWSKDCGDSFRQILSGLPEVTSIRVGQV